MTADISTDLSSWSTTAASNQPDYSDSVGPNNLADNLRAIQAAVRLSHSSDTITAATSTDLSTKSAFILTTTGASPVTITGFGTVAAGIVKVLVLNQAHVITHNATSLILPTGASITGAADDVLFLLSLGSGNWRCINYMRKTGASLTSVSTFGDGTVGAPGMGFTSDTDTGVRRSTTNTLCLVAGGADSVLVSTTNVDVQSGIKLKQTESGGYTQIGNGLGHSRIYTEHSGSGGISSLLELNATGASGGTANLFEIKNSGGLCFRVRDDGATFADGAYSGSGADFAEWFDTDNPNLLPGDVVCMENGKVRLASVYDDDPIGVISTNPAVIGNSGAEGGALVGLVGQLWVKHGQPRGARWKLMKHGPDRDLYLVR